MLISVRSTLSDISSIKLKTGHQDDKIVNLFLYEHCTLPASTNWKLPSLSHWYLIQPFCVITSPLLEQLPSDPLHPVTYNDHLFNQKLIFVVSMPS